MKRRTTRVISVVATVLLVATSMAVMADHMPEEKKDDPGHKGDDKYTYIGLLLGDHIILCFGDEVTTPGVEWVNVSADVAGNPVGHDQQLPGGGVPSLNIPVPFSPLCLGGAFESETSEDEPDLDGDWTVWADDFVYRELEDHLIVPAMFAQYTITKSSSRTTSENCVVGDDDLPDVCITETESKSMFREQAQFSVCGKGSVGGMDEDAWDDAKASFDAQGWDNDNATYTVTKAVFMDGPIFFSIDCGLTPGEPLASIYTQFARWFNNDPDNRPDEAPFDNPATWIVPFCNPGVEGETVCLFDFPAGESVCFEPGDHIPFFGTIGTIGWHHEPQGCQEPTGAGNWTKSTGSSTGVSIENFPDLPVSVGVSIE